MPENWSWRTRQLLTYGYVSVMLLRSMQSTKELADAKAENDALRDDVAAGRRRLHIKAVCQSVREATTASGVDGSPDLPRLANCWTGLFHLRNLIICKNNWKEPRSILMSSADRVAHIDGQLALNIVSNTPRWPILDTYKVIKPAIRYRYCWVSVLTTFLYTILAAWTGDILPRSKRRKWWVMVSFGATAAGFVLNSKRLLAHPVISRASAVTGIFLWCSSRCFLKLRIVCVEN